MYRKNFFKSAEKKSTCISLVIKYLTNFPGQFAKKNEIT
jgi:hypothetical protein